ncbi:ATP-binding cassette domain-containing protein [Neobacillus sp. FSL H8-0543]|uniref:ATP-binding cassette domain-containing protein n=1 Tax=Neobacillus sp. FSL H8-0543 TaxID=2954672 RepID=UPI003158BF8E
MRIVLDNIEFTKANVKVFSGISCSFKEGVTYVIGNNGAGKSELLKIVSTAIIPDKGTITYTKLIRDKKVGTYRKHLSTDEVRKIVGFMPQHFTGYSEMTIERYLTYMAFHKGIPHKLVKPLLNEWLSDANLVELKRRKLRTLSGGERQKVGLIQALINQPRICILDEPFEGLDTHEKQFFNRVIQRLSFHSVIIISTHLVEEIERSVGVSILYMEEGKLSYIDSVDELSELKSFLSNVEK